MKDNLYMLLLLKIVETLSGIIWYSLSENIIVLRNRQRSNIYKNAGNFLISPDRWPL